MAKKIGLKTKTPMPCRDARERAKTFAEVALGYAIEMAVQEADRCIQCKNQPCVAGCPVEIDIPGFLEQVARRDMEGAYRILIDKNVLPAICGRVCPQEDAVRKGLTLGVKGSIRWRWEPARALRRRLGRRHGVRRSTRRWRRRRAGTRLPSWAPARRG
jgi:glutamate synthase (NADPH) small chain